MEKITLSKNICAKVELRLIRDSSLITLKLTPRFFYFSEIKSLVNLTMKVIITNIILEDGYVYENEACHECQKVIDFDFFNYNDFMILFASLKKIAEKKYLVENSISNKSLIRLNRIQWPDDKKEQYMIMSDICNYEINFQKNNKEELVNEVLSLNMRVCLIKILQEKRVLEKETTRLECRNILKNNFENNLFDENWRYLQNVFSMKKS